MSTVIVQPDTYGLDAASFRGVTDFAPVKAAGADWVSFYIGGQYGVGPRQIEGAWAAGLPVMPNFERDARAGLGGYPGGQLHANTAMSQLTALGFERDCPVVFSAVDFGPTVGQFPALDEYHRALVDTLAPADWCGGAYGPRGYLQHLNGLEWWPNDWPLWHWGGDGFVLQPWAWCKQWYGYNQTPIDSPSLGYSVDENTLLRPMAFWSGYGATPDPPPHPVEVDVDMPALFKSNDAIHWPGSSTLPAGDYPPNNGHVFTVDVGGAVRHVTGNEFTIYGNLQPPVPVAIVAGMILKGLIDDFGVYQPVVSSNPGASPEANADELARRLARDA